MVEEDDVGTSSGERAPDRTDPEFWKNQLGGDATAARIVQDHDVGEAIRAGRMRTLYELLRKRSRSADSRAERSTLTGVLAHRRWFAEPTAAPGMFTLNGIGTMLKGSKEKVANGTYIATLFFTFLFIPIWPIREYLVHSAESKGWHFLARVPMSNTHRTWRRVIFGGALGLALLLSFRIWDRQTHDEVSFLNGLDFAITIEMDGEKIEVPPDSRTQREFGSGDYHVVTRDPEGVLIEELDVTVPGGHDLVAYSVLGAAPMLSVRVAYGADDADPAKAEAAGSWKSLAGLSWVEQEDVDFAWQAAPESMKMRKSVDVEVRSRIDVDTGGWRSAVAHLSGEGRAAEAATLARRVAMLRPGDVGGMFLAYQYTLASGDTSVARALVEKSIEAAPDSIEAHRLYQTDFEQQGETAAILPGYKTAFEREPDSAHHGYLYARIAAFDVAAPILARLVERHPDHPWIRRGVAWSEFQSGHWSAAAAHCIKGMELQPEEAGWFALYSARAACADGRADDGLKTLRSVLDAAPAREKAGKDGFPGIDAWSLLHAYSCLHQQSTGRTARRSVADSIKPFVTDDAEHASILARLAAFRRDRATFDKLKASMRDTQDARGCELVLLSREDVAEAARLVRTDDAASVDVLDDVARLLITCELLRGEHHQDAKALFDGISPFARASLTLPMLVRLPALDGLKKDPDPDLRAVVHYVAYQRADSKETKAAHLAEARRLDTLGLVVPD